MRLPTRTYLLAAVLAAGVSLAGLPGSAVALHRPDVTATFRERSGDSGPGFLGAVDITDVGGAYEGGTIALRARMWESLDPREAFWRDEPIELVWLLDTTGDGEDDWVVHYYHGDRGLVAEVTPADGEVVVCEGVADFYWYSPSGAPDSLKEARYLAYIPASCVGTPAAFDLAAAAIHDDPQSPSLDLAPDEGYGVGITRLPGRSGYWLLAADGAVYGFGDARNLCTAPRCRASAADIEATPSMNGYWVLDRSGGVHPYGDARWFLPGLSPLEGERAVSLSATPTGFGLWIFTSRGRVLTLGDAPFLGDVSGTPLNGEVVDSVATPSGRGYYMVASDGGVFAFGDAKFRESMGGRPLNAPVRSLVPDADGAGYWLVATDGGIFAFDAPFRGSMGGTPLNKPVRGMVRFGDGYLMVAEDGGIFNFSSQPFSGSLGASPPASPVVSVAALDAA